ncbi:MAG: ABC transporter substrate-binding protein [Lachnospiraceae bacterium]|nr:ABC transporter substrate-binding protein [Lachnospiraceae bacterium]
MKKKLVSLLLSASMVAALVGCGGGDSTTTPAPADNSNSNASTDSSASNAAADTGDAAASDYQLDTLTVVVDGTLTATLDNGQPEFEAQWEAAVSEAMGHPVDLVIQQLDHSGYTDAIGRLFAGGDYPDAMIMPAAMFKQYAPTGLLWDMASAYDNAEFQSRMILPTVNENLKDSQGRLYGFAYGYGNGCVTYVKKAWLDAVGLNADDIKTYDDYYDMLMKFHNEDPDGNGTNGDTYGVIAAGFIGNEAPYINYLPEFWQDAYPAIYPDASGTWVDGFQSEETKAALLRLQQAYKDGAIDPESLTASTKIAREKWFSNDQTGSAGVFTYWAGTWYQTLTDNLVKNDVDSELVQLAPIAEVGSYLNRESPVWVIIDDGDGNDAREQAIFDTFIETMMDGDVVQTLWTYGAEGVHWSTEAESFVTNPDDPDKKKEYEYEAGVFHLKPSPNDANSIWKKNLIDPALVVCELTNGYADASELAVKGNKFFTENCVDAPASPSSETYTNETGNIYDAQLAVVTEVVVNGGDVDAAMANYVSTVGGTVEQILAELNAAE